MKLAHKALLYSALIYPGGGHFLLRYKWSGICYASIASVCLLALMIRAIEIAQSISEQILLGEIALDIMRIRAEIYAQLFAEGSTLVSVATWSLIGCWAVAGIDAFRLGRNIDRTNPDKH